MASKRKPKGYWTLENTIFEAKKLMEEHKLDVLPSHGQLIEIGCSGLNMAINRLHGGFSNFREKHLGEEVLKKPNGYYQNLETTISEAKKIMKEHNLDKFPTQNKLKELGYGGLSSAITKHHGGFPNFRKKHFGEESSIKPHGYYTLENTINEANKIMKEHGLDTFPSYGKLNELGYSGLGSAINKLHGGLNNFRVKHLGEELLTKPHKYWTLENTISESKKLMKEHNLDKFPTQDKLRELGYSSLSSAIRRHHGGLSNFRKKHFGEESSIKPHKYWESLENTISEVKNLMEIHDYDTLPSSNKLTELGYGSLANAIIKHHGGFPNFKEKHLGEESLRKPNGYYTLENTISESKKLMKEHNLDTLPTQKELLKFGYSGLSSAIIKHHGGLPIFKEKHLGEELSIKPNGYWLSLEHTIYESKKVMKEQGVDILPPENKLNELGYGGLSHAILKHHGGMSKFREKHLGEKPLRKPGGYWESLETCLDSSKSLMKEHNLDTLPTQKELLKFGYSGLNNAIMKYHGGFSKFRKLLGEKELQKPIKYWNSLKNTISEAKKVMKEYGFDTLPPQKKLTELGYGGLINAISRHHGGITNFREIMNQELGIKSNKEHLTEVWKKYTGK